MLLTSCALVMGGLTCAVPSWPAGTGPRPDAAEKAQLLRAQQVPPFLNAVAELTELFLKHGLIALVDLLQRLDQLLERLLVRSVIDKRLPEIHLIHHKVD